MSRQPTRGQWRGYAILTLLLLALLAIFLFLPRKADNKASSDDMAMFKQSVLQYKSELTTVKDSSSHRHYRPSRHYNKHDWHHDTQTYTQQYSPKRKPERPSVEINTADTAELQLLRGIGPAFARRIVNYREKLGGFVRPDQLLEVYGMDNERYNGFADKIIIDTHAVTRIDINSASLQQLKQHPYLDYYQARSIVNYRNRVGQIHSLDELSYVNTMDSATLLKIKDYIQF